MISNRFTDPNVKVITLPTMLYATRAAAAFKAARFSLIFDSALFFVDARRPEQWFGKIWLNWM